MTERPMTAGTEWCDRCGGSNLCWSVASPEWNMATRNLPHGKAHILCPQCFVGAWERETGGSVAWNLSIDPYSRDAHLAAVPLTNPDGETP